MTGNKPRQEFQHVTVLLLPEVRRFITSSRQIYTPEQVGELVGYFSN